MKTPLLTTIFSIMAAGLMSQPVLHSNSFYQPGDYLISYDVDANGMEDGSDGANKIWDFSEITPLQQSVAWSGMVTEPSNLDDFDFFEEANVALQLSDGTNRYWKNDESGLSALGQGGDQSLLEMTDANLLLAYPFTFGSIVSDNASGTIYSTCRDYEWSSTSETEGVGYGTLLLPSGTYENVLKVRRISFTSKQNEEIGMDRENNIVEHFWFQPGTRGPLLYMRTWNNNGCPGSNSGAEMVYTIPSTVTEIPELSEQDFAIDLFPNPARNKTHLGIRSADPESVKIWLTDYLGQTVLSIQNSDKDRSNGVYRIDLESLSPGLYVVNVKSSGAHRSQRLVVQ